MIGVSPPLLGAVQSTYGRFFTRLSGLSEEKCARDVLDEAKVHQNTALFQRRGRLFATCLLDLRSFDQRTLPA